MKTSLKKAAVKGSVSSATLKGKPVRKSFNHLFGIFVFVLVRRARPTLKFGSFTYQALCDYSKNVTLSLTGNLTFPTPSISLSDQTTANDAMLAAILACGPTVRKGSLAQRQTVRDARAVVEENLRSLADYVDGIAAGDAGLIISSGFLVSQMPARIGLLGAPTNFRQLGKKVVAGSTALRWGKVKGASSYNVYTAATTIDPFILIATVSKTSFTATSAPGRLGYYTVRAVGAAGLGIETTPIAAHSSF